jgi:G3E family GTPase
MNSIDKIPVTVITDFPGAGKTTSLNRIISEYQAKKFDYILEALVSLTVD